MLPSVKKAIFLAVVFCISGMLVASMLDPERVSANYASSDKISLEQLDATENVSVVPSEKDELKPVDNVHHFMEYIVGPVTNDLKKALEKEPTDKAGWTKIKTGSLILAETSILLADRPTEKGEEKPWKKYTEVVYKGGSALYKAARKKDFPAAKKHFGEMVDGCAKCHAEFK